MNSFNPVRILQDIRTGELENFPIGIKDAVYALAICSILHFINFRISAKVQFQNSISTSLYALALGAIFISVLLIVCRAIFYYEKDGMYNLAVKLSSRVFYYVIGIGLCFVIFNQAISILVYRFIDTGFYIEAINNMLDINYSYAVIYICIVGPFIEEIIFRGVLLGSMLKRFKPSVAIIASTMLFALIHLNIPQFIAASILGAVLGVLFKKYRSLTLCFMIHALNNSISIAIFTFDRDLAIFKSLSILAALLIGLLSVGISVLLFKSIAAKKDETIAS